MVLRMPGRTTFTTTSRPSCQAAPLPEGELRGHTFHHTRSEVGLEPYDHCWRARGTGSQGEAIYRDGRLSATYLHAWFPSNPEATAQLFRP